MSMISEQINALRELADIQDAAYKKRIINRAVDTIESLSAKSQAANCGEWIPCSERLPEEPRYGDVENPGDADEYIVMIEEAKEPTCLYYAGGGQWFGWSFTDIVWYNVTAWMRLPAPPEDKN